MSERFSFWEGPGRYILGRVTIHRFRVLVQEQRLVLQGCASTYYAKRLAQHVTMEVIGLPILANEIEKCHESKGSRTLPPQHVPSQNGETGWHLDANPCRKTSQ